MNPILSKIGGFVAKRSVGILAGAGVATFVGAMFMVAREAPKCKLAVDSATAEKGEDLTTKEKAKIYAKHYWKPAAMGAVATASIIASVKCGAKKRAAVEAAYILASNALTAQSDKIVEKYGKDAFDQIRAAIAKDRIANPPARMTKRGIFEKEQKEEVPSNATVIYHDAWTGYEFETTPIRIIEGVSKSNMQIRRNDELSLNEFFDNLNVKHYDDETLPRRCGDMYGWQQWKGPIELEYKVIGEETRDGITYLIMGFNIQPTDKLSS